MTRLEQGTYSDAKVRPALVALVEADVGRLAIHLGDASGASAVKARRAFRPQAALNPIVGRRLGSKVLGVQDRG